MCKKSKSAFADHKIFVDLMFHELDNSNQNKEFHININNLIIYDKNQ